MLTDKQREKLAHFMGWELGMGSDGNEWWGKRKSIGAIVMYHSWLNPPTRDQALLLLEKLGETHICGVYRTTKEMEPTRVWRAWVQVSDDRCIATDADACRDAVVDMVLAMLEAGDE